MTFVAPAPSNRISAEGHAPRACWRDKSLRCFRGRGLSFSFPIGHSLFGHTTPELPSQFGAVAADEPRAAMIGRDVLLAGGNAADARPPWR